ncbi:hypothetical protein AB4Y45_45920 [Paraburkholderia sp. EG287A]|uniref:hypothetical protein n=1 Tax=unclassified Paraburkholderia TaxID=2615204 RepID=UPI0034D15F0F
MRLTPGNLYSFWGMRSLHANQACLPTSVRSTVLLHFGDPHEGSVFKGFPSDCTHGDCGAWRATSLRKMSQATLRFSLESTEAKAIAAWIAYFHLVRGLWTIFLRPSNTIPLKFVSGMPEIHAWRTNNRTFLKMIRAGQKHGRSRRAFARSDANMERGIHKILLRIARNDPLSWKSSRAISVLALDINEIRRSGVRNPHD